MLKCFHGLTLMSPLSLLQYPMGYTGQFSSMGRTTHHLIPLEEGVTFPLLRPLGRGSKAVPDGHQGIKVSPFLSGMRPDVWCGPCVQSGCAWDHIPTYLLPAHSILFPSLPLSQQHYLHQSSASKFLSQEWLLGSLTRRCLKKCLKVMQNKYKLRQNSSILS